VETVPPKKTGIADNLPQVPAIFHDTRFFYGLIAAFFIFYLLSGIWIFGLLVGVCLIGLVALEFLQGTHEHGLKTEIKETAIALLLAVVVWFGAGFVLQTPSPLNAIVSCSMLPHVQRGDMIVLQGGLISAPHANVSSLVGIETAQIYEDGQLLAVANGSLYGYCALHRADPLCDRFVSNPPSFTERHGELLFGYDKCEIVYPKTGARQAGPCVSYLEVGKVKYRENLSNSIVVYQPNRGEYYSRVGDIIHRAFITLTSADDNRTYFLTKGDNNPVFDIQVYDEQSKTGNLPVEISRSKGRVILQAPFVGYLKLFISPSAIATPDGCDRQYAKWN